jgi:hypothetical protein
MIAKWEETKIFPFPIMDYLEENGHLNEAKIMKWIWENNKIPFYLNTNLYYICNYYDVNLENDFPINIKTTNNSYCFYAESFLNCIYYILKNFNWKKEIKFRKKGVKK